MMTAAPTESFLSRPWRSSRPPGKILVIRFHALGDVIITLPYLQALRNVLPPTEVHCLTREECADIPRHASMFTSVHALEDGRRASLLSARALGLLPRLLTERYDVVLDLQRNALSRVIRWSLRPSSFAEFDRFSLQSAGERVRRTIDALELTRLPATLPRINLQVPSETHPVWLSNGYSDKKRFVVLNPAGSSITKNWPIENYERFAALWTANVDADAHFLVIGTERIAQKARYLQQRLGERLINLVNVTTPTEALSLVGRAQFILTEDSGLMHMGWISQVPLIALFGSTPSVWSRPLGDTSVCLDSSDLECGNCGRSVCRFGDVRCLTRWTPESVLETARQLLHRTDSDLRKE